MVIYGVSFLGACYILILAHDYFNKRNLFSAEAEKGILFWSQMYIPVIVAMSATQNVVVALNSGLLAILAGVIPVFMCFACIPLLVKLTKSPLNN